MYIFCRTVCRIFLALCPLVEISNVYMDERNPFNLLFANVAIFGSVSTYSPRPPYYAFFAFLWLFMVHITARFTHTGDGQRLQGVGDRLSNLWEWWNCIFSDHISFILNKMWDKQKAIKQCKQCNNDSGPWIHVIDEHMNDERFVQIMIMISTNKQGGWIKSWLLCNEGAVNPYR